MHMDKTSWLASKESKEDRFSMHDIKERVRSIGIGDKMSIDRTFNRMKQRRRGRFGNDR